jgi:hypothetical protein
VQKKKSILLTISLFFLSSPFSTGVALIYEVLGTLAELMKKGIKVSEFLSDGMPVVLQLARELNLNCDEVLKLFSYVFYIFYIFILFFLRIE